MKLYSRAYKNADYLGIAERNLIVLDDHEAQYGEDKRIVDRFTTE